MAEDDTKQQDPEQQQGEEAPSKQEEESSAPSAPAEPESKPKGSRGPSPFPSPSKPHKPPSLFPFLFSSPLPFSHPLTTLSDRRTGNPLTNVGNSAGDKIESGLSPVGRPVGKGLETVTKPIGGIVDGVVGGLMRTAGAFGEQAGVGAGNMEHKNRAAEEELRKPVGGQEQTGGNPLGLSDP